MHYAYKRKTDNFQPEGRLNIIDMKNNNNFKKMLDSKNLIFTVIIYFNNNFWNMFFCKLTKYFTQYFNYCTHVQHISIMVVTAMFRKELFLFSSLKEHISIHGSLGLSTFKATNEGELSCFCVLISM